MLDQKDLDVVAETKREMEAQFRERMLDGIAVVHQESVSVATSLCKSVGGMPGVLAAMTVAKANATTMTALAKQLGIAEDELLPNVLEERYYAMKREGRLK